MAGKVYSLDREQIEEQEDRSAVVRQMLMGSELKLILQEAREAIEKLDLPLKWPNEHYDQQATLDMLTDLMPTQTLKEMELDAEVRRVEMRAAERNGQ